MLQLGCCDGQERAASACITLRRQGRGAWCCLLSLLSGLPTLQTRLKGKTRSVGKELRIQGNKGAVGLLPAAQSSLELCVLYTLYQREVLMEKVKCGVVFGLFM